MSFSQRAFDESLGSAFLTNLLLLGFDPYDAVAKYKVKIDSESFTVPNHKAFQVVTHFLILCFDPKRDSELSTCWPICSKKDERQFRSICYSFFKNLMETDPSANFPHFSATLFLSPGGPKFYLLFVAVTTYLLARKIRKDYGEERLLSFSKSALSLDVLRSSTVLEVNKCEINCEAIKKISHVFEDCSHTQSAVYWKISNELHSLEKQIADEVLSITGTTSAERYYEETERTEKDCATQLGLVHKGWEQVDQQVVRAAAYNKTIEAAIHHDKGENTFDGSGSNLGKVLCLEKLLRNFVTVVPTLENKFSNVSDAVMSREKSNITGNRNETLHQIEEIFPQELKLHLAGLLKKETDKEVSIHDSFLGLLQPTPELHM